MVRQYFVRQDEDGMRRAFINCLYLGLAIAAVLELGVAGSAWPVSFVAGTIS